jgi:hypothetical protein
MAQYRFVGNIPAYVGDAKYSKIGDKADFSEADAADIQHGGGTFISEAEYIAVFGENNKDVEKYGGNPALRKLASPDFLDRVHRAQQIFRDTVAAHSLAQN